MDKHLFSFNPPQIQIEEEKKSGSDEEEGGDSKFKPDFDFSAGEKTALKSPFIFSAPFQPSPLPSGILFKEAIMPSLITGKLCIEILEEFISINEALKFMCSNAISG